MAIRKKCPQVYWSQTNTDVNLIVDLLLDDVKPNIKLHEKFISLEAYGFGSTDNGPHEYYFEINLFESIDTESSIENISNSDAQLQFVLKKTNPDIWWSRLTAQPQKQNWIHIHEKTWISRDKVENEEAGYRDIRVDYPGIDDFVHEAELGYRKSDRKTVYLLMYNLYQFIAYLYIVLVLSITLSRDGFAGVSKIAYKTVGGAMKCSLFLQYLEFLNVVVGYTKGSPLFPLLQVSGRNFVLFIVIHSFEKLQTMPVVFILFTVWALAEVFRYPYYIIALLKKEIPTLTWLRYSAWVILYPMGVFCETIILVRSLPLFEETKRFSVQMPNKWNFAFDMNYFLKFYIISLMFGFYFVLKHMKSLRAKKLKIPQIHGINRKKN